MTHWVLTHSLSLIFYRRDGGRYSLGPEFRMVDAGAATCFPSLVWEKKLLERTGLVVLEGDH